MPVTIVPGSHQPKRHPKIPASASLDSFLVNSCPDACIPELHVVASSFAFEDHDRGDVYPSSSSFIRSAIEAWGRHSHLVLRPEDVWFTILIQVNFYMERNAEQLRHLFVAHEGKQRVEVSGSWHEIVDKFRGEMQNRIKTSWMSDWISPGFSTSTVDDERTATVLMMGLMKSYFEYAGGEICGIPSITLLGSRTDWQRLLGKFDRFADFGTEPDDYASRLRPLLSRFVATFDDPVGADTKAFWDQMVQARVKHDQMCGVPPLQYIISGWIVGLFYWHPTGHARAGSVDRKFATGWCARGVVERLEYDGVFYGEASIEDIPNGYAKVPFEMFGRASLPDDPYHGWLVAGNIGKRIMGGAPEGYTAAMAPITPRPGVGVERTSRFAGLLRHLNCFSSKAEASDHAGKLGNTNEKAISTSVVDDGHSTIQPLSGWFLFGPQEVASPFADVEELCGQTVDAINSCEGVQHYHTR